METPTLKRARNFLESEKQLLIELIENEFSVILVNNKSTFTKNRKETAWKSRGKIQRRRCHTKDDREVEKSVD